MPTTEQNGLVRPKQAAKILGLHLNTIYRYMKNGVLDEVKAAPRVIYVTQESIDQFLKGQRNGTSENQ